MNATQRAKMVFAIEFLEPRELLSADRTKLIDATGQPITATYPAPLYATTFAAKVNFQPATGVSKPLPQGYVADTGKKYGSRTNGLKFGWSSDNTSSLRRRNASRSPDVRYDTLAQFNNSRIWEIAVPKGTYYVRYTVGDPNNANEYTADTYVEGRLSLHEHIRANNYWIERGIYVNVTDGKLTISTRSASTQKINWIEITGQTTRPAEPVPMTWQSSNLTAPVATVESESVQIGSKLYVFGGFTKDYKDVSNELNVFDLQTETWTRLADLPETQTHMAVSTDGRYIYVLGGQVGTRYNSNGWHGTTNSYKYDTETDTWSAFISAPAIWFAPFSQLIDNRIYVFAGAGPNRNDPVTTSWVLDLSQANPTWKKLAPMPHAQDHGSSVYMNGKIYFLGGDHDHSAWHAEHDYVFSYEPATGKWTRLADLPIQSSHFEGSVFVHNDQIFALGGAGDGQVPLWRVSAYSPSTNKWTEYTHSPIGRIGAAVGVIGNKLYYVGGEVLTPDKHTTETTSIDIGFLPDTAFTSVMGMPANPVFTHAQVTLTAAMERLDLL